jgi:hypothetical protein
MNTAGLRVTKTRLALLQAIDNGQVREHFGIFRSRDRSVLDNGPGAAYPRYLAVTSRAAELQRAGWARVGNRDDNSYKAPRMWVLTPAGRQRRYDVIVTVTNTVMDGLVVRWYRSESAERRGVEFMSASRNGVMVGCYLHEVHSDLLAAAKAAYRDLSHGIETDVRALATHKRNGPFSPLEPVVVPDPPEPGGAQ